MPGFEKAGRLLLFQLVYTPETFPHGERGSESFRVHVFLATPLALRLEIQVALWGKVAFWVQLVRPLSLLALILLLTLISSFNLA